MYRSCIQWSLVLSVSYSSPGGGPVVWVEGVNPSPSALTSEPAGLSPLDLCSHLCHPTGLKSHGSGTGVPGTGVPDPLGCKTCWSHGAVRTAVRPLLIALGFPLIVSYICLNSSYLCLNSSY